MVKIFLFFWIFLKGYLRVWPISYCVYRIEYCVVGRQNGLTVNFFHISWLVNRISPTVPSARRCR
jgi:hypothetical protein